MNSELRPSSDLVEQRLRIRIDELQDRDTKLRAKVRYLKDQVERKNIRLELIRADNRVLRERVAWLEKQLARAAVEQPFDLEQAS